MATAGARQLCRQASPFKSGANILSRRSYAAASVSHPATGSTSAATTAQLPPLNNIEASWKGLAPGEQESVFKHLEELQKKDWKELTVDQKKAAYYVSFGPHGPREPLTPANSGMRIFIGTIAGVVAALGLFEFIRQFAAKPAHTHNPEWAEQTQEMLRGQNANPFTGVSSDKAKKKDH